jgi:hypothetical protein
MHANNVEASLLRVVGIRPEIRVPLALATSVECRNGVFGLDDIRVIG